MKNIIKNSSLLFESDSYNVEPWVLSFAGDDVNYFWRPIEIKRLGTAVCFPLIGSVPDNKYLYDGKEYSMGMHGFAQNREFTISEQGESFITYELVDDDSTYQQFPWHFNFKLKYALENDSLKTEYTIENRDSKTLFFSVGGHPRFTCPLLEGSNFEDYYIEFEKPESISSIVKSYGPMSEIEKRFSSDGKRINLSYAMFSEGCFCFSSCNSSTVYLKSDKNSRGISIDLGGADHLQFWTRPDSPFIAIEPFFGSISSLPIEAIDGDWVNKPNILHIEQGEIYTCSFSVKPLR